ncbi:hypothetical protein MTR67_039557 [Solanum verrucosum]|uniref:Uncharacterized protein n=1 Tax=Solanum verrucosum TaxID=315347 RepID=A0AAF0ZNP5_SOLVR|nr:hypothetical protein MTR67_039557 [Solanum verrucosum]
MMIVTINDRAEFPSYQIKDVAHIWFTQWKENRGTDACSYHLGILQAQVATKNNVGAAATCVQDFVRMNPPEFLGSQVGEHPRTSLTRYDLPSGYAFQIELPRKAYPRNANSHNANVVLLVPNHKALVATTNNVGAAAARVQEFVHMNPPEFLGSQRKENRGTDAVPITWKCFRYDLPSSYAFQIKPPRKAYPNNANHDNANAVPPVPDHKDGEDPRTSLTRYDLPSSYAFQVKPHRNTYPRNANAQNANAIPPVPDH